MNQASYFQPADLQSNETIKACCVALYDSDWASLLLGDSYHPGKLTLTERMGDTLGLAAGDRVLDLASGIGTSAIFLAQTYGCQVIGVDFAKQNVERANANAVEAGLADLVQFKVGDAE